MDFSFGFKNSDGLAAYVSNNYFCAPQQLLFTHLFGEVKNFLCGAQNVGELQF